MAVAIRLTRVGRKKSPHYRLVVADSRFPRDGRFIEILGHYQPLKEEIKLEIDQDRALHWLEVGAQPSDTVRSLLRKKGIMKTWHERRVERKKAAQGAPVAEPVAQIQPAPEPEVVEESVPTVRIEEAPITEIPGEEPAGN